VWWCAGASRTRTPAEQVVTDDGAIAMLAPWNKGLPEVQSRVDVGKAWRFVPRYRKQYDQIQEILTDERFVSNSLESIAGRATSPDGIKAVLREIERRHGFSYSVVTIDRLLNPDVFMSYVAARRPLLDLGAGKAHGSLSHRLQWAILAMAQDAGRLQLREADSLADLYAGLSQWQAWSTKDFVDRPGGKILLHQPLGPGKSLWDHMVDRPYNADGVKKSLWIHDARAPEYLMHYMKYHPNASVRDVYRWSFDEPF
jgi:hypothetical protein